MNTPVITNSHPNPWSRPSKLLVVGSSPAGRALTNSLEATATNGSVRKTWLLVAVASYDQQPSNRSISEARTRGP
jgi:hypothetical protein